MKEIVGILSRTVENVSKFLSLLCEHARYSCHVLLVSQNLLSFSRCGLHEATKFIYEAHLRYMLPHRPTISDRLHV